MILDIFGDPIERPTPKEPKKIDGLTYIPDWITNEVADYLWTTLEHQRWETLLNRRVQQYGYRYDYRSAGNMIRSNIENYIGPIPEWIMPICIKLKEEGIYNDVPDQIIINEYLPGQGIANHIDCVPCFGDVVVSLSLGSGIVMDLDYKEESIQYYLEPNSILILTGDARYKYSHGIRKNKTDIVNGKRIPRSRRVAITFRKML